MPTADTPRRRRLLPLLGGLVVLVAVAIAGYVWWTNARAADEVSLDAAADAAADDASSSPEDATTSAAPADLEGTWEVQAGEAATVDDGTFVGYRVQEELAGIGAATATGRTPAVTGTLVVEDGTVTTVEVEADLTQLRSDSSFRDGALGRQGLELNQFPTASFVLTQPVALPDGAADGAAFSVAAVGDLTLHGVTRAVTWPLEAQLVGATVVVVGSLDVAMADYDITPPNAQRVLAIDDAGVAELQLRLTRG